MLLQDQPRAIWYVLDEETSDWPSIRAERGPGNRSWVRRVTTTILDRLFTDTELRSCNGMFISPFKAQAHRIAVYLAQNELHTWSASTVHSQQGAEADVVIFDTVNAGSYSWPYDEWKRLVNVALSRAREACLVLASRAEMQEPYLHPLLSFLSPRVLRKRARKLVWEQVPAREIYSAPNRETVRETGANEYATNTNSLGYQISTRKLLRPVLSREQERLCGLTLDGKPRLVRGVAGSGKTIVLAHWLAKTVKRFSDQPDARIWAVFANRSLQALIANSIETAWDRAAEGTHFPWERVSLLHIREILDWMLPEVGLRASDFRFEYDNAAAAFLERRPAREIQPACDALFIDEAQDMGPNTLKLLSALVRQVDGSDTNSRAVNIFYDNAQNIYGRGTPRWSEFGLDLRGRSTVMNESFRSTKPIIEFALNVLYRLQPPENDPDHKELLSRGLVERTARGDAQWWTIRFNQIDGPKPTFRQFTSTRQEMQAIGQFCRQLIEVEGVDPADICLLYNGQNIKRRLEREVAPRMAEIGVTLSVQTGRFERCGDVLLATTPHSFKGYDAEIVIVPGVDWYVSEKVGVLASNLYVAMTRARSMLVLFAENRADKHAQRLYDVLGECMDILEYRPKVEKTASPMDDVADLVEIIGEEHRKWLVGLLRRYKISQEPLFTKSGEIIAQPLFWFATEHGKYACFAPRRPSQRIAHRLEDFGFNVISPGDAVLP
ncbi:MAG: hypothetical protein KatS3mg111_3894 [Pirellulaceae bacterium]|nr:MAG: hypothetical protein KatS3mg111_3894 [Pirellulaceae bacterium]